MIYDGLVYTRIDPFSLDALLFKSRVVAAVPAGAQMNFLFLREDNKTFDSLLIGKKNIWHSVFIDPDNPFAGRR